MQIATILFTYHRSYHTEKVLESLKRNTVLPQKLFVFQDGLKLEEDDSEWKKVNKLINEIDWCDTEVVVSNCNKGLAGSVVSGINYAFRDYDAVIVLEDDCVSAPSYMQFMVQGLTKYQKTESVYAVSGYSWPIALEKVKYDAYSCGRVSSWGWGTWKDRWEKYKKDIDILKRIKAEQAKSKNLSIWGRDLESMLLGTISGQFDSWGVFWALNVIENGGICINPYISLIQHIGWDGTGTNTFQTKNQSNEISSDVIDEFVFPDDVAILDNTKKVFAELYGNNTAVSQEENSKENVLVYGLGNFYSQSEKDVNETYNVQAFVDKRKHGYFAGKKIITIDKIVQYQYDKILVMVLDIQECINIVKDLKKYGIEFEKIILGSCLFGNYKKVIDRISIVPSIDRIKLEVSMNGIQVRIQSKDEFWNAYESLVGEIWNYSVNNSKQDVVLDVGMNIGDTVLYFLHQKNVKKVYGYEPFKQTYLDAADNLQSYLHHPEKVEIFQYGISKENSNRIIDFNRDMTCGQSTIVDIREEAYEWYRNVGLVQAENEEKEFIQVKDAEEVFLPIIQAHSDCNIVLKMNCEGEEYNIMERLSETGLLNQISIIMLEWHYRGKEDILKHLDKAGFTYWFHDKERNMGLIYACKI